MRSSEGVRGVKAAGLLGAIQELQENDLGWEFNPDGSCAFCELPQSSHSRSPGQKSHLVPLFQLPACLPGLFGELASHHQNENESALRAQWILTFSPWPWFDAMCLLSSSGTSPGRFQEPWVSILPLGTPHCIISGSGLV